MVVSQIPAQRAAPEDAARDWWQSAACLEADPELFFPVTALGPGAAEIARAKAVCATCRVRRQCLQYALATRQLDGIWGGVTAEERRTRGQREREHRAHWEVRQAARAAGRERSAAREGRARPV